MSAPDDEGDGSSNDTTHPEAQDPSARATPSLEGLANTVARSDPDYVSTEGDAQVTPEAERYELRGELGRGGQSVVQRAWDTRLEREVALKELRHDSSDAARDRFWREARITARLEHPNIVPVYEIGRRPDGTLFTVQRLMRSDSGDGQTRTLRAALEAAPSLQARLALLPQFLAVCQGIAYAHAQGILHRDLKPENVMLGQFGETVILDWGLARVVGDTARPSLPVSGETAATVAGVAYGTPAYMSPEQAHGEVVKIDARSDVWSLGAMLFELLTGRPPFIGRGAMDVVEQVRRAPVPAATALERRAPPELAAIAARALQRDPSARYPSANALAEEVTAWQSGRRVSVYDYSLVEAGHLFVTRHSAAASTGLAVVLALLVSAGVIWLRLKEARRANAHALVEKARAADRQLRWNEAALYYSAARLYDDNPETQWGVRCLGKRQVPPPLSLSGQTEGVKAVAFSPDGARLATASVGGVVRVFRAADGTLLGSMTAHVGDALSVAWSADGTRLATSGTDGRALLWNAATLRHEEDLGQAVDAINRVALSVDGRWAVIGYEKEGVDVVELGGGARRRITPTDKAPHPVYGVAIDPRGDRLALVSWTGLLEIRRRDGALLQALPRVAPSLLDVKYAPDGSSLAVAGNDKFVRWYDLDPEGRVLLDSVRLLEGHDSKVYALSFSADSQVLASASTDQTVRLWHKVGGRPLIGRSMGGVGELEAIALSPDGTSVAVGGQTSPAVVYALPEDDAVVVTAGDRFEGLQSQPGLPWYAFASAGGPRAYFSEGRTEVEHSPEAIGSARELSISRDGKSIAWPCERGELCVGDALTLNHRQRIVYPFSETARAHGAALLQAVALAPDGSWLAAADRSGELRVWSLPDGAEKFVLTGHHQKAIYSLDVSRDGKLLASGSYDQTVRLWDPATGTTVATLRGHSGGVRRVRFSPDGKLLATTGWDRTVRLWDVATFALLRTCQGHEDHVFGLDWAPDGHWLASAGRDGTVRIWDPKDCRVLATLVTDEMQVFGLAVWGDGKGLSYSGTSVHAFAFQPLGSPSEQFHALERRTGLTLDEEQLVAIPLATASTAPR